MVWLGSCRVKSWVWYPGYHWECAGHSVSIGLVLGHDIIRSQSGLWTCRCVASFPVFLGRAVCRYGATGGRDWSFDGASGRKLRCITSFDYLQTGSTLLWHCVMVGSGIEQGRIVRRVLFGLLWWWERCSWV